jgi:hypothetical protein
MKKYCLLSVLLVSTLLACVANSDPQPVEAGKVSWGRDVEAALTVSQKSKKPVFALFQEIPGCAGCKQFGKEVMSHPLLVAAVEAEFVPLLIHNNKPGKDAEARERFSEPAWNFQVIRFLDGQGTDVIPRKDQVWDTGGVAARMIATLKRAGRPIPGYLQLLADESAAPLEKAVFSMSCFWTGEMVLGQLDGVISTEAGFLAGREVVMVEYAPSILSASKLMATAQQQGCQQVTINTKEEYTKAPTSDQKRQIMGTYAAKLPLTPSQATKVNAWIRQDPLKAQTYLTASQKATLPN